MATGEFLFINEPLLMNCLRLQPEVSIFAVGLSQIQTKFLILTALAKAHWNKFSLIFRLKPMAAQLNLPLKRKAIHTAKRK